VWVNIEKRLREWVEKGVIPEDSAARIAEFERSRSGATWIAYSVVGIGATALCTGLLSLVAANWAALSDVVKLTLYFSFQLGLGVLCARYEGRAGVVREMCLTLFALAFLLGIALIGQLYNLSGPLHQTLGFWLLLSFGPTCIANAGLLPALWCVTTLWAAAHWSVESLVISSEFGRGCVVAAVPFLMAAVGLRFDGRGVGSERFRRALKVVGLGTLMVVGTPWINLSLASGEAFLRERGEGLYLVIPWLGAGMAIAASLLRRGDLGFPRYVTAVLILTLGVLLTVPILYPLKLLFPPLVLQILGAVGSLSVWALAAAATARAGLRRLFDVCTFVIGARFVVIYFEVFGDLTTTGIGLVISGTVVLCAGLAWSRLRRAFGRVLGGRTA